MDRWEREEGWVFVFGAPRSGTTLMGHLVGLHERCECLYETNFPIDLFNTFFPGDGVVELVNQEMPLRIDTIESAPDHTIGEGRQFQSRIMALIGHGSKFLKRDSFVVNSDTRSKCIALTQACCSAVRRVCQSSSTTMFGDKNPEYCFWWGLLHELFPKCKMIFIERDREENAMSMIRCGFNDSGVIFDMPRALAEVERYNAALSGSEWLGIHKVTLEDLEADPPAVIYSMVEYLELDPSEYPINRGIDVVRNGSLNRSRPAPHRR